MAASELLKNHWRATQKLSQMRTIRHRQITVETVEDAEARINSHEAHLRKEAPSLASLASNAADSN